MIRKYFTKSTLLEVVAKADEWNFNAQLPVELVQGLKEGKYPVGMTLPHNHRDGQPCEEHRRCCLVLNGKSVTLDVPLEVFENLPEAEFMAE